jgi:hypothetical protein
LKRDETGYGRDRDSIHIDDRGQQFPQMIVFGSADAQ